MLIASVHDLFNIRGDAKLYDATKRGLLALRLLGGPIVRVAFSGTSAWPEDRSDLLNGEFHLGRRLEGGVCERHGSPIERSKKRETEMDLDLTMT